MAKATKVTGTRTLKAADTKGPKPGSARANQSAPTKSDIITTVKGVTSGAPYTMVSAEGQETLAIPAAQFMGSVAKAAVVGGSYAAAKAAWQAVKDAPKPTAKLANGIDGRNSPHSAKSVADQRAKAPAATKADKKVVRKEAAKAKAAPKGDDTRKLTLLRKDFTFGAEGSARNGSWLVAVAVIKAKGTAADYIAKGGKAKYLPRWVSAGAIKLG